LKLGKKWVTMGSSGRKWSEVVKSGET